ncbi:MULTISPECIES: GGDEF domain-containing protein [Sphingomonadaceae]|uniref:diguanylate cyclase n=1 Tax=Rhizorhabdus wittichii TaxID=160791 RepID=A0A975D8P0_9SPHN|nr:MULTISPECIES: GGDEF domain-containing protein [Sphingomonadaceae]QTH24759.1 GGDEF domain-containing protein [Rhizorhabdus wittichii]QUM74493.1 GGDEF domain-containing protein [Sphingopyxis granuli]
MNSHLPVGRLAERLEALSREQVWLAIVIVTGGIAFVDRALPGIGFAPVYMTVICAACWRLGPRSGYFVAIVAAFLAVAPSLEAAPAASPAMLVIRVGIRIVMFVFLAATVTSFRYSYDRELFHAHQDRMTGTLNKEVFHRRSAKMMEDAKHKDQTLLLLILDLDDFKAVNSREGHRAGDEVLRAFANGVSSIMRREDLVGRIGGDEFALLVRVPSMTEGQVFALDLHARLSALLASSPHQVTCSMGALLIPPEDARNASELMHAADLAMYRAKQTGKNAVEIATVEEPQPNARIRRHGRHRQSLA